MVGKKVKSLLFWIVSLSFILILSSLVGHYRLQYSIDKGTFNQDLLYRLLGESRRIFSRVCMMRANEYFHGGVTLAAAKCQSGANHESHQHHHDHEYEHDTEHEHVSAFKQVEAIQGIPKWNFLVYLGELIKIDAHMHLKEEEQKEMVPWYVFATELDPHNIHAYVIGGHWIGKIAKEPPEALEFLYKGLRKNPTSWKIHRSIAEIFIGEYKDYSHALEFFQKAADLFTAENVTPHESWQVYMYIGACHEHLGNKKQALITYSNILKYFPGDKVCEMKVKALSE